jgi:hypothetical protein
MKPLPYLASVLILVTIVFADDQLNEWQGKKVPQLILASGKIYTGVTFSKIEADAISIIHSSGVANIFMEELKPESQAALGYDPGKAAIAREVRAAREKEMQAARLKEAEKAAEAAILTRFTQRHDEFKDRYFFTHIQASESGTGGLSAYISTPTDEPENSTLFMLVTYRGEDWIFMDEIIFAGSGKPVPFEMLDRESDVPGHPHPLHEWCHIPILDLPGFVDAIANADSYRLSGKFVRDYEMTAEEKTVLLETAKLYLKIVGEED